MTARRVLVSGGSKGLGLAFCRHYLERGYSVFTFARSQTDSLRDLGARFPETLSTASFDLTAEGAAGAVMNACLEAMGGVDVLINNAAVGQDALFPNMAEAEIVRIIEVNVSATLLLTRRVAKQMILQGGGTILNVSSICGTRGFPGLSVYAASKGALDAFTRSLASELGPLNVRVNAVAPGFFRSEMSEALGPTQLATIERRTPTRRLSKIEDVVRACDVLLDEGSNITGQVLAVDGGASIA